MDGFISFHIWVFRGFWNCWLLLFCCDCHEVYILLVLLFWWLLLSLPCGHLFLCLSFQSWPFSSEPRFSFLLQNLSVLSIPSLDILFSHMAAIIHSILRFQLTISAHLPPRPLHQMDRSTWMSHMNLRVTVCTLELTTFSLKFSSPLMFSTSAASTSHSFMPETEHHIQCPPVCHSPYPTKYQT